MSPELFAMIFVLVVFAGVFIVFMGLRQRSHHLEMLHRERMALIERGIVPGPEDGFAHGGHRPGTGRQGYSTRSMSLGIIVVAIGLGLMTIISVAGEAPETGIGVGGAIAIVGAAFIVNSLVNRGQSTPSPRVDDRPQG